MDLDYISIGVGLITQIVTVTVIMTRLTVNERHNTQEIDKIRGTLVTLENKVDTLSASEARTAGKLDALTSMVITGLESRVSSLESSSKNAN